MTRSASNVFHSSPMFDEAVLVREPTIKEPQSELTEKGKTLMTATCIDPDKRHHFVGMLVKQTVNPDGSTINEYVMCCVQCGATQKL